MSVEQTIDLNRILHDRLKVSQDAIAQFCRRWKVTEFALFGSVLRDDFRIEGEDRSDIDVLVVFDQNAVWNLFDVMNMQRELEGLLDRKVDLLEKQQLRNPYRRNNILKSHRVVYAGE